ncbi:unnamed protein product [Coregonus sp. 'balchen']|nr:unnamed protein product [Coregonus sp. 'balchen']
MWTPTIALLFMCSHCFVRSLDFNVIRSSKEAMDPLEQVQPLNGTVAIQNNVNTRRRADTSSNRHHTRSSCPDQECSPSTGNTCNGSQKKNQNKEIIAPDDDENIRKVAEMATCVRSGDCEAGLCCVRYLTGKRCQRIPKEGEACLLGGRSKLRRNLERCNCARGLTCRAQDESPKKPRSLSTQTEKEHEEG